MLFAEISRIGEHSQSGVTPERSTSKLSASRDYKLEDLRNEIKDLERRLKVINTLSLIFNLQQYNTHTGLGRTAGGAYMYHDSHSEINLSFVFSYHDIIYLNVLLKCSFKILLGLRHNEGTNVYRSNVLNLTFLLVEFLSALHSKVVLHFGKYENDVASIAYFSENQVDQKADL